MQVVGFILIAIAWIIPNVSNPWASFWMESVAGIGLLSLFIKISKRQSLLVEKKIIFFFVFLIIAVVVSYLMDSSVYFEDCFFVIFFSLLFVVAVIFSQNFCEAHRYLFSIILFVTIVSCGIALTQWLIIDYDRLYIRDIPPGNRYFANTGQPNHLGTLINWGVVSVFYFYERREVSKLTAVAVIILAIVGIHLTQSRTAILQLFSTVFLFFLFKYRKTILLPNHLAVLIVSLFFSLFFLVKEISEIIKGGGGRDLIEMGARSSRFEYWYSMLHAVLIHPFGGWGVQGGARAQIEGSFLYIKESIFQYSHNILLDAAIWFGLPVAIAFLVFLFLFYISLFRKVNVYYKAYSFFCLNIFLIHCMLEYPFAYLHVLIPVGLFVGIIQCDNVHGVLIKKHVVLGGLLLIIISFLIIMSDYIKIENYSQVLRFQKNNIITEKFDEPNILILEQTLNFIKSSNVVPSKNISPEAALVYYQVALRYGTYFTLLNASLAALENNDEAKSVLFLESICKIHSADKCTHAKNLWGRQKNNIFKY